MAASRDAIAHEISHAADGQKRREGRVNRRIGNSQPGRDNNYLKTNIFLKIS
jgi:hypothetical protein